MLFEHVFPVVFVLTQRVAAIKLSAVGAGHARDEGTTTLQSLSHIAGMARSYEYRYG